MSVKKRKEKNQDPISIVKRKKNGKMD